MCLATHAGALDRCNGYVAGCNTTFFGYNKETKSYSVDDIRDQINARLTMANGDDVDYPSMLCFPESWDAATQRDQVISISNRVLPWDTTNGDTRMQFPGGEEGWKAAGGKGLEGIHYGEDLRATSNQGTPSAVERGRLTWQLPPSPTHTDSQPHPACVRLHRGVDGQQLDLLPRPAPRLLAVERDLPGVGARAGPLWPRRASGGAHATLLQILQFAFLAYTSPCFDRMPAGAVASRCRASRRATR